MTSRPGTLFDALSASARQHAGRPAMTFLNPRGLPRTYTYNELFAAAAGLAPRITAANLDRRAPVGILVEPQECQVIHYLAILTAGHIPAILTPPSRRFDRAYYAETMRSVLSRCGFSAVITDVPDLDVQVRVLRPYTMDASGPASVTSHDDCSAAAFLQFSSGTTGMKRGIVIDHAAALAQFAAYREALGLTPADCVVSWLPLYHDFGFIAAMNLPLLTGVHVVMLQPHDWVANPASYLRAVTTYRGTVGFQPNFAFAFMANRVAGAQLDGIDLTSLRALVNASETVTHSCQQRFLERFAPCGLRADVFCGLWGMAEMTLGLTAARASDRDYLDYVGPSGASAGSIQRPVVSVGKPIRGVELRIVGDDGRVLGDREIGEVMARSPFKFSRYHNNPEATAKAFVNGWYRTGDLGYRVRDALFICGRRDDILIVNGVNVYPQDLEEIVSAVPGVKGGRTVAFSMFDAAAGSHRILVLVEPLTGADADVCALEARRRLCSVLQVSGFDVECVPAGWLLKSSAGKIARELNRRKWLDHHVDQPATGAP